MDPDVAIFAGRPGRVMLLQEAAARAGVSIVAPLLGRPTCAALPASLTGGVVASTGCIGNRVYTNPGDDKLYVTVPSADLSRVADAFDAIVAANATLRDYHVERRRALGRD